MASSYKKIMFEWMKHNEIALFQHHHAYAFKASFTGTRLKIN